MLKNKTLVLKKELYQNLPCIIECTSATQLSDISRHQLAELMINSFIPEMHELIKGWLVDLYLNENSCVVLARNGHKCVAAAVSVIIRDYPRLKKTPYAHESIGHFLFGAVDIESQGQGEYQRVSLIRLRTMIQQGVRFISLRTQHSAVYAVTLQSFQSMIHEGVLSGFSLVYSEFERASHKKCITNVLPPKDLLQEIQYDFSPENGDMLFFLWELYTEM